MVALLLVAPVFGQKAADLQKYDRYYSALRQEIQNEVQSNELFGYRKLPEARRGTVEDRLRRGEVVVDGFDEEKKPNGKMEDALVHHWRGTILIPKTDLATVLAFAQDYDNHSRYFTEDVMRSKTLRHSGNSYHVFFKFRRKKVITVCYNTEHDGIYYPLSAARQWSESRATKIAELADCESEKEKPVGQDHGFLWKFDSFWKFEQVGADVVIECTSLSLSRDIPFGLALIVRGFVDSIPRESLERTLRTFVKARK
ncbi:MAG: hypothetical protein ACR2L2_16625 [Acidobacteriota bacterium]